MILIEVNRRDDFSKEKSGAHQWKAKKVSDVGRTDDGTWLFATRIVTTPEKRRSPALLYTIAAVDLAWIPW